MRESVVDHEMIDVGMREIGGAHRLRRGIAEGAEGRQILHESGTGTLAGLTAADDGYRAITQIEVRRARSRMRQQGVDDSTISDDDIRARIQRQAQNFHERAPTTAAEAAKIILDAVKTGRWRVLVGEDAHKLDERVRANPERAYDPDFGGFDAASEISASAPRIS